MDQTDASLEGIPTKLGPISTSLTSKTTDQFQKHFSSNPKQSFWSALNTFREFKKSRSRNPSVFISMVCKCTTSQRSLSKRFTVRSPVRSSVWLKSTMNHVVVHLLWGGIYPIPNAWSSVVHRE